VELTGNSNSSTTSAWTLIRHGVPQGLVLGPLLFLIYVNNLTSNFINYMKPILFADDTTIIVSNTNIQEFKDGMELAMNEILNWCQKNLITINFSKMLFVQFLTKQYNAVNIQIKGPGEIISNATNMKFLGLWLDNTLSWKAHITELMMKLTKACYAIRAVKPIMSQGTLRNIYFSYFHSLMSYGYIFWGNSHAAYDVFKMQKRAIRILSNKSKRDSCRNLFKDLQILTQPSQYIYSLTLRLLMSYIYGVPFNAIKWQMGFNSVG
jgi:hypothetical protein